jgi:hypothetical protein
LVATQAAVIPPSERLLRVAAAEAVRISRWNGIVPAAGRALSAGDQRKYADLLRG